jgi:hypothetical protein
MEALVRKKRKRIINNDLLKKIDGVRYVKVPLPIKNNKK